MGQAPRYGMKPEIDALCEEWKAIQRKRMKRMVLGEWVDEEWMWLGVPLL